MIRSALAIVAFAVAFVGGARAQPIESAATRAFVLRSEVVCRDAAKAPPFWATSLADGVRFRVAIPTDSTCFAVAASILHVEDKSTVSLNPTFNGVLPTACEVTCPGLVVVDGWITGRPTIDVLAVQLPSKRLVATKANGSAKRWTMETATVSFTSKPTDAAVFRNMQLLGRTPLTVHDEPAGIEQTYHVVKGELAAEETLKLKAGETRALSMKLVDARSLRPPRVGDLVIDPTLDADVLMRTIKQNAEGIRACVEEGRKVRGVPKGRQVLVLTIEPNGRVSRSSFKDKSTSASPVGECVRALARRWKFPPFAGEASDIEIPLILAGPGD